MAHNMTGRRLGQYELRERLGRGGMAEVYKAFQAGMDRFVAVKIMLGHLSDDEQFVERFRREAQAVGKLRHGNIVNVFDFGIEDDIYYMVMEYITGGTLKQAITARGSIPLLDALRVTDQMADALDYAHKAGMIHRDLKPANIMFSDDTLNNAILTDFGIARILTESGLTTSGMMVGTPAYMSPEAGQGLPADERADIYALGIILYEMLTGTAPYMADTPMAVVMKHIMSPIPPLDHLRLPEPAEMIILQSMAKAPEERYQTAADMRTAVRRAIREVEAMPEAERDVGMTQIAVPTPPMSAPVPVPSQADDTNALVATDPKAEPSATVVESAPSTENNTAPEKTSSIPIFLAIGAVLFIALIIIGVASGVLEPDEGTRSDAEDTIPVSVLGGPARSTDTPVPTTDPIVSRRLTATAQADNAVSGPASSATPLPSEADPTPVAEDDDPPPVEVENAVQLDDPNFEGIPWLSGLSDTLDEIDTRLINGDLEQELVEILEARLADEPDNVELLAAISTVYFNANVAEEALDYALRAVELAPDSIVALAALSDAYTISDDDNAEGLSLDYALQAYEIEPDNPAILWRVARGYINIDDSPRGQDFLEQAIAANAGGYRFAEFAGNVLLHELDDPERALPYLSMAVESPIGDFDTLLTLGDALLQLDEEDIALERLNASADAFGDWWEFYFYRGLLQRERDDTVAARADFETALSLAEEQSPDDVPTIEAELADLAFVDADNPIDTNDVEADLALLSGISPTQDELDTRILDGEDPIEIFDDGLLALDDDPENTELMSAMAVIAADFGEGEAALELALRAYEIAPDNPLVLMALSDAYIANPNYNSEESLRFALAAFDADPNNPAAMWRVARGYVAVGDSRADEYMERALNNNARGIRFIIFAGEFLLNTANDPAAALPYLELTFEVVGGDYDAYFDLMVALIQLDNTRLALDITREFEREEDWEPFMLANFAYIAYMDGELEQALDWLDNAARRQPNMDNERWTRALVLAEQGDYEGANTIFESLVEQDAIDTWPFLNYRTERHLFLDHARVQLALENYDGAIASYTASLDANPYWPLPYVLRGNTHLLAGNTDDALADYSAALPNLFNTQLGDPVINEARQNGVNIVFGDDAVDVTFDIAEPFYTIDNNAIPFQSGISDIDDDFTRLLYAERDEPEALAYLDDILRVSPNDSEALATKFGYYLTIGNTDAAAEIVTQLMDNDYDNIVTYTSRIDYAMYWSQDEPEAALDIANEGLAVYPDNPHLLWRRASAYIALGEEGRAIDDFLAARDAGASGIGYAHVVRFLAPKIGDSDYAIDAAILIHTASPTDHFTASLLLQMLLNANRVDEAFGFARSLQHLGDVWVGFYNDLAYIAYRANQYDHMEAWLQIAFTFGDEESLPLTEYLLALLARDGRDDPSRAVELLSNTAYEDNTSMFVTIRYEHARNYDLTIAYLALGDLDLAVASADALVEDHPGWWRAYLLRGEVHLARGAFDLARADFNTARDFTDNDADRDLVDERFEQLPVN